MSEGVFTIRVVADRPSGGMWHCGPNPSWVTVTHLRTMVQVTAYHPQQHKAREMAMACAEILVQECRADQCQFPEALIDAMGVK